MTLESLPEHLRLPHLRPLQPMPLRKDGKAFIALRDPAMLSKRTMIVPAQAMAVLQHFQGQRTIHEIAQQINGNVDQLIELAKELDRLGLLWGPTFERLEAELKEKLQSKGAFPATASRAMGKDEAECRSAIEGYLDQTDDPELESPAAGIVAPHLDYERGWPNYAAAYYGFKDLDPPDRVVILGTNHFGLGDGVVISEYGFDSPMGQNPADSTVIGMLVEQFGRPLIVDQLDHLAEHSIQLQLPWVQYFFGDVPIIAALIPDPLAPMIADDDERVRAEDFVTALGEALQEVGGTTRFVASSDLSHVGPQFGEPRAVDEQRRFDVERHDREMLVKFLGGDAEEFLAAMRWNKNPTRWCSIGSMAAMLSLIEPETVELIDYRQAYDERGFAMVSSASLAMA